MKKSDPFIHFLGWKLVKNQLNLKSSVVINLVASLTWNKKEIWLFFSNFSHLLNYSVNLFLAVFSFWSTSFKAALKNVIWPKFQRYNTFVLFLTPGSSNNLLLLVLSRSFTTSLQPPPQHTNTHRQISKPKTILKRCFIDALPCGPCLVCFSRT